MNRPCLIALFVWLPLTVQADIDVGSDGSDGALDLTGQSGTVTIDLSLATDATWDTPSPVAGRGVYDADQWAIVFKYTSINIPASVHLMFSNHPSRAPVVWLSQGNVTIDGIVNVSGLQRGRDPGDPSPPYFAEPGPGGFRGGRAGGFFTAGFGPGGGNRAQDGQNGSYATAGSANGVLYGNEAILPLIGGSGGGAGTGWENGGGAGGGAILIAANSVLHVSSSGQVLANGRRGGRFAFPGGHGSGGGIRLIANRLEIVGTARLVANEQEPFGSTGNGGNGRIRLEANEFAVSAPSSPSASMAFPTCIFPPPNAPRLRATTLNGQAIPADPRGDMETIQSADMVLDTCDPVTLDIEAENIPEGTMVNVRVVPPNAPAFIVQSTPLSAGMGSILTATATVQFPIGNSAVQLRAAFDPTAISCSPPRKAAARGLGDPLRTLNGERIVNVEMLTGPTGGGRLIYTTEKGARFPVDPR